MTDNNKERILVEIKTLEQLKQTMIKDIIEIERLINDAVDASTEYWQARTSKLIEALAFYSDEGNYTHDDDGNHLATAYGNNACGSVARKALKDFREGK